MGRAFARMGEARSDFTILSDKPTEKRALGRPGHRWKDNITIDFEEISVSILNWTDSVQEMDIWKPLMNVVFNL